MYDLNKMEPNQWLELNAKLQKKKNALRKELSGRGIMQKQGTNKFDNYKYFTEAQYKLLFTELFANHGLELKFNELEHQTFEGSEKQANGRMPRIEFDLIDAETGFFEATMITGEGIDKGDKAGYKAYTGALKYYLADTFMVATGDDPEDESPQATMNQKRQPQRRPAQAAQNPETAQITGQYMPDGSADQTSDKKATVMEQIGSMVQMDVNPAPFLTEDGEIKASPKQVEILREKYTGDNYKKLCYANGVSRVEDITAKKAAELIEKLMKIRKLKGDANNGNE